MRVVKIDRKVVKQKFLKGLQFVADLIWTLLSGLVIGIFRAVGVALFRAVVAFLKFYITLLIIYLLSKHFWDTMDKAYGIIK